MAMPCCKALIFKMMHSVHSVNLFAMTFHAMIFSILVGGVYYKTMQTMHTMHCVVNQHLITENKAEEGVPERER